MIVTGSHLLKDHGMTINEIKKDGFKISSKFSMYERNRIDSGVGMIKSLAELIDSGPNSLIFDSDDIAYEYGIGFRPYNSDPLSDIAEAF